MLAAVRGPLRDAGLGRDADGIAATLYEVEHAIVGNLAAKARSTARCTISRPDGSASRCRRCWAQAGCGRPRRRAADLVSIKFAKCGGIGPARRLLAVAEATGVGVLLGSMMETHVGVGATASLATVSRSAGVDDLDAAWWLSTSPVRGGLRYDGARVVLPDAPGLGIEGPAG